MAFSSTIPLNADFRLYLLILPLTANFGCRGRLDRFWSNDGADVAGGVHRPRAMVKEEEIGVYGLVRAIIP